MKSIWVLKGRMNEREGRIGRNRIRDYCRLVTKSFIDKFFEHQEPKIRYSLLNSSTLTIKSLELDDSKKY
uniref:Transposase n=1 Tax=Strongyloides venezuelensis TaxID=75913 RepID=A0A0K0F4S0_STRVS